MYFFFSSRRRHTRCSRDWSSDVCSSDLTLRGLITYYVLFFIHLESRRICLAGVTRHPDQEWMEQMARNVTMEDSGFLIHRRYLLHDHDSKYSSSFRQVIEARAEQRALRSPDETMS